MKSIFLLSLYIKYTGQRKREGGRGGECKDDKDSNGDGEKWKRV